MLRCFRCLSAVFLNRCVCILARADHKLRSFLTDKRFFLLIIVLLFCGVSFVYSFVKIF